MYNKHFGFLFYPFGKDIPPDETYPSAGMSELTVRLGHLAEMSGIGLITGDSGSGKSTACRAWAVRSGSSSLISILSTESSRPKNSWACCRGM